MVQFASETLKIFSFLFWWILAINSISLDIKLLMLPIFLKWILVVRGFQGIGPFYVSCQIGMVLFIVFLLYLFNVHRRNRMSPLLFLILVVCVLSLSHQLDRGYRFHSSSQRSKFWFRYIYLLFFCSNFCSDFFLTSDFFLSQVF